MLSCKALEVPAATTPTPPPPPMQGAAEVSHGIFVTQVIELSYEQIRFDINELIRIPATNKPWKSCYVPTGQIEPKTSDWDLIKSAPGIYSVGKSSDGKFYEVAVCESYFPWLVSHGFKFQLGLDYDRAQPADAEIRVYGILPARRMAQVRFLENAIKGILSGRGRGFEQYYRRITPYQLRIPLERALLNHHVLTSDPEVRNKLCQWIVVIGLGLVKISKCRLVFDLLRKNRDQLLQGFRQDYTDLLEDVPTNQWNAEFHRISLYWLLFVSCGGEDNFRPLKFDPKYTANDNANMIGSLVDITGSNRFGDFDPQVMLSALSQSKVFTQHDISTLDIANLTSTMMTTLPIGFPKGYLDLPTEVIHELGTGQVGEVRAHWSQIYRQQPSLKKSDNNILVLLIWTSITSHAPQALSEWAASDDGSNLRRRLLKDIKESQTTDQLALTLVAWLCLQRLLPCSSDTTQSIKGCFLADFGALLTGERLSNECIVLTHMAFSFSQGLGTFGDDHQDTRQLLDTVLDTDTLALKPSDTISVQYWICRMKEKLAHQDALGALRDAESKPLRPWYSFRAAVSAVVLPASINGQFFLPCALRQIGELAALALWYNFWVTISAVMLYMSINLQGVELFLAYNILLFSTCGEFFHVIKGVLLRHSPQQPGPRILLAHAFLCFLKLVLTCVLFSVSWRELIKIDLSVFALVICALQITISRTNNSRAQSPEHDSCATWREVQDLEMGRQYSRRDSLAELNRKFDYTSYTLVRLSNLGSHKREGMFVKLDKVGRLHEVSSALELPDESWEMVVLKSYLPELEIRLGEIFPGCHFDPNYDPTEPSREDVECLFVAAKNSKLPAEPGEMVGDIKRCYTTAKILRIEASSSRAMAMIREGSWPVAAAYYSCLLERNTTWLKENTPHGRIEAESCWTIRDRSWRRYLSLLTGNRRAIFLSRKDICLGSLCI